MVDENLFKYFMAENGDDQRSLANAMGIHYNSLNLKIKNKYEFTFKEILFIAKRFKLTIDDVYKIFGSYYSIERELKN